LTPTASKLRVCFFEAGCQWVPFLLDRMEHCHEVAVGRGCWEYRAKRSSMEYARGGNIYFGFEVDDRILPEAIDMLGPDVFIYASDIPHGDREWDSVQKLNSRTDIDESAKQKLLVDNGLRFYGL